MQNAQKRTTFQTEVELIIAECQASIHQAVRQYERDIADAITELRSGLPLQHPFE